MLYEESVSVVMFLHWIPCMLLQLGLLVGNIFVRITMPDRYVSKEQHKQIYQSGLQTRFVVKLRVTT